MDHDEVVRLHGPWVGHAPAAAAALLDGYDGRWWVAGGWAVQSATGVPRVHGDLDIGIPREDALRFRRHLAGRFDVWAADHGTLRLLVGDRDDPPGSCVNLWLRRGGADPWEFDVLLSDVTGPIWTYRRDPRVTRLLVDVLVERDGVRYLRPEVQLLHKAPGLRPVDQADLDTCLPRLTGRERAWLVAALATAHPGHPWIAVLAD